jgi:hypothetical protein
MSLLCCNQFQSPYLQSPHLTTSSPLDLYNNMSRPPYNIFLGTHPATQPRPNGPPANIVAHSLQMLNSNGADRPPPNIVAHAERMVAEEASRRRDVASRPPPPPYQQVWQRPQVAQSAVVQQPMAYQQPVPLIYQQPMAYSYPPVYQMPQYQQYQYPYVRPFYPTPPPTQVLPYSCAQPHYIPASTTQQTTHLPPQSHEVETFNTANSASLIQRLWEEEAETSQADAPTSSPATQAAATLNATAPIASDAIPATDAEAEATVPIAEQPPAASDPGPGPDPDLLTALQASLQELYQSKTQDLSTAIRESLRPETERLENLLRRHEIASVMRLLDYVRGLRERETREERENLALVREFLDGHVQDEGGERGRNGERQNAGWGWGDAGEIDELEEIRRAMRHRERRVSGLDPGAWDGNA